MNSHWRSSLPLNSHITKPQDDRLWTAGHRESSVSRTKTEKVLLLEQEAEAGGGVKPTLFQPLMISKHCWSVGYLTKWYCLYWFCEQINSLLLYMIIQVITGDCCFFASVLVGEAPASACGLYSKRASNTAQTSTAHTSSSLVKKASDAILSVPPRACQQHDCYCFCGGTIRA